MKGWSQRHSVGDDVRPTMSDRTDVRRIDDAGRSRRRSETKCKTADRASIGVCGEDRFAKPRVALDCCNESFRPFPNRDKRIGVFASNWIRGEANILGIAHQQDVLKVNIGEGPDGASERRDIAFAPAGQFAEPRLDWAACDLASDGLLERNGWTVVVNAPQALIVL